MVVFAKKKLFKTKHAYTKCQNTRTIKDLWYEILIENNKTQVNKNLDS